MIHNNNSEDLDPFYSGLKISTTSFRKTIIFLKNIQVYAILLVDLFMEKIHEA